jgi:hypothetical protein
MCDTFAVMRILTSVIPSGAACECSEPGTLVWYSWWSSWVKQSLGALAALRSGRVRQPPREDLISRLTTDEESCCSGTTHATPPETADVMQGGGKLQGQSSC